MEAAGQNPFRPGAGHPPPHLAGRAKQVKEFDRYLKQDRIASNVILTGLRGVGKTVLMDMRYKPLALESGWAWVGSDFSESAFLSEDRLCTRILTDLAVYSSGVQVRVNSNRMGLNAPATEDLSLDFDILMSIYESTPGLSSDKLKAALEFVWESMPSDDTRGIVFAYDEAQVVSDREEKDEYPLAVLLETFQSIQKKGIRFLLLLTGLPTLFPRLVESRTYAERMFAVQDIGRLTRGESRDAIEIPMNEQKWRFSDETIKLIVEKADGYPYFIQFICRQLFDQLCAEPERTSAPIDPIIRQLDSDFFGGRWDNLTDRQRDFLYCVAMIDSKDNEFTIAEVVEASGKCKEVKRFTRGDASQMLPRLIDKGLVYKNRFGKYSFAVPLFREFIRRAFHKKGPANQRVLFE